MVATWAEKEMRNLLRMHQAGIRVPKPHLLKVSYYPGDFKYPFQNILLVPLFFVRENGTQFCYFNF